MDVDGFRALRKDRRGGCLYVLNYFVSIAVKRSADSVPSFCNQTM